LKGSLIALVLFLSATGVAAECWQTPDDPSPLRFVASQAGAPIEGSFGRYSGRLCLPSAQGPGSASVEIDTSSIDMGTPEFDAEMRGPLFLAVSDWPTAEFAADTIVAGGEGRYQVSGELRIRDITLPLTTEFGADMRADTLHIVAEVPFDRLDFDLGLGEWQDTTWVGAEVTVKVDTLLVRCMD
jgi:polyisoprenoid-binding protein YceI